MTLIKNAGALQELATGSLPTLGGDPLQPSWSRSLQELMAANQSLIGSSGPAPPQPTAAAQLLLGSDRTNLGSLAAAMETAQPAVPKTRTFANVEETCRRHRDGIIERILKKERAHRQKFMQEAVERQLEEDWAKEREWWMKELKGSRNVADSTASLLPAPSQTPALPSVPSTATSTLLPGYTSPSKMALDLRFANDHLQLLRATKDAADLKETIARLLHLAVSEGNSGYKSAWQLVGSMIPNLTSPINGALGSLVHYCKQYQAFIKHRVSTARLSGQDLSTSQNFGSGMAGTIAAYVKFDYGSNADIWHILYFCLRCGDVVAARDVMNGEGAFPADFPEHALLRNVITSLAQRQGNATCVWEMGTAMIPSRDMAAMVNLYERARNLESNNTFKIGVLALLSRNELASFKTIEDYMFGRLWRALQSDNPAEEIERIGESIRKYGPEHFGGADENGGWRYALPLLASQQFQSALTFLAEAGGPNGLLQAAHIGLVLAQKGIPIKDLNSSSSAGDLITPLLVKYANALEVEPALGVGAALEYVLRIPNKEQSLREVSALVCRSHQFVDQFAGIMKEDGARQEGELDKHLPKDEVSAVLGMCADTFRKHLHDRVQAELSAKFYMLAGQYAALVSLLNDLLAPTDQDSEIKRYWWTQSQQFYEHYLSKRTIATVLLEKENALHLVSVNKTLMQLRQFFTYVRNEQFREGFDMIKTLDLLPFTQEQVNEMESKYKDMNSTLKAEFPAMVVGVVRCLHGMHRKLKSESRGVDQNIEFQLRDLQMKSRFIYVFSGLTNMPSTAKEDIQRLRNNMI